MNSYEVFGIIMGVIALVLAIVYIAVPYAIKRGWKAEKYLQEADKDIDIIKGAVDTVSKIAPIPQIELIDKILNYADKAVQEAEQLYKIGEIKAEDRKPEAKNYITHILNLAGIEVTPDIQKVIDGAVEAGVFVLPKTNWSDLKVDNNFITSIMNTSIPVSQEVQDTIKELHSDEPKNETPQA